MKKKEARIALSVVTLILTILPNLVILNKLGKPIPWMIFLCFAVIVLFFVRWVIDCMYPRGEK